MLANLVLINWFLSIGFIPCSSLEIGKNSIFNYNNSFVQTAGAEFNIGKYVNIFTTIDVFEIKAYSFYFDPYRTNFTVGLELFYNGFELGITHECNHDIITGWDFNEYNGIDGTWMNIYLGWSHEFETKNAVSLKPQLYMGYRPYDHLSVRPVNSDMDDYFGEAFWFGKYDYTIYGRIGCAIDIYKHLNIDLMIQPEYSLRGYGWNSVKGKIGITGYYKNLGIGIDWITHKRLNETGYGTNKITISATFKGRTSLLD